MPQMFWFRPVFMFELLFAQGMFAYKLKKRNGFWWRLTLSVVVCFGLSFLMPYKTSGILNYLFVFFFMFLITVVAGTFIFEAPFKNVMLSAVIGYTTQHIASELYEIFSVVMGFVTGKAFDFYATEQAAITAENYYFLIIYLFIFVVTYTVVGLTVVKFVDKYKVMKADNTMIMTLCALILFIDIVVSSIVTFVLPASKLITALSDNRGLVAIAQGLLHFYNFLCCLLVMVLVVELPRRYEAEAELYVLNKMRHREKEQYKMAKESVEIINVKCHDLKHRMYSAFNDRRLDDEECSEIARAIDIYDSSFHTGSEAFNVVMSEKSLICKNRGIDLSCIVNAPALYFMKDYDVYSLFGNLMDNAIEATSALEKEKRSISLKVTTSGALTVIKIFNSYTGQLNFNGDIPLTTKRDRTSHGYGLKSIKHIVEKYNGTMSIKTEMKVFAVTIAFSAARND